MMLQGYRALQGADHKDLLLLGPPTEKTTNQRPGNLSLMTIVHYRPHILHKLSKNYSFSLSFNRYPDLNILTISIQNGIEVNTVKPVQCDMHWGRKLVSE